MREVQERLAMRMCGALRELLPEDVRLTGSGRQPVVGRARPVPGRRPANDRLRKSGLVGCLCARDREAGGQRSAYCCGSTELEEGPAGQVGHGTWFDAMP